jgi:glycosyltransferase involved in cell wall biosynthesis
MTKRLFRTFFMGGFESSTHKLRSGKRLDLLDSTQHIRFARQDFQRLEAQGIRTVRSAIRWHLIEQTPYRYDFSSVIPYLRTVHETNTEVIWDLCHYGYPDDIDIFSPEFIRRFSRLAAAFARMYASETDQTPFICPMNEISFFSWGGGDVGYLNPFAHWRGFELKVQLARASIEAMEAVWNVLPEARFVHVDPVINIVPSPDHPEDADVAEGYRLAQYEGWDLISGRKWSQIGGHPKYLDIIGVNYYHNNQWIHNSLPIFNRGDPLYRPFRQILHEVYERYERPMIVSETGIEDDARPEWLRYVSTEVAAAIEAGVPVEGICLYPVMNHPGWDNDRHCHNGLWDYCDENGEREIYQPLADEIFIQQHLIEGAITLFKERERKTQLGMSKRLRKRHLVLFTDSDSPSGTGEHMLLLANELKCDYRVTFICPPSPEGGTLLKRAAEIGVTALPMDFPLHPPIPHRKAWETLRDWLRTNEVNVFHVHAGISWEGVSATQAAYHAGVPCIVRTEHLPCMLDHPGNRMRYFEAISRVDQVICVSEGVRVSFKQNGVPQEKLTTIYSGTRYQKGSGEGIREVLGVSSDARLVLTPARFAEQKGHCVLLDAVPAILEAVPEAVFLWAGKGDLEAELHQTTQERGLKERIKFLGYRSDMANLLCVADSLVLPSLFEGFPLVVLEAMAANVPIVATDIGGTNELIEDGIHGRLVPVGDSVTLAQAIIETLTQPEMARLRAKAAYQRYESRFDASRLGAEVGAVYQVLLHQELSQESVG